MDHQRLNTGLLAAAERRLLIRIAGHLPRAVHSDHLTYLALFSMLMTGVSFAISRHVPTALWGVAGWLAVNWFGDSLDGTLARVRNQQRPRYGFYVDHVFDSFGALFVLGGLALSGHMTPLVAVAVLVAYLLLSIEIYLATYSLGTFEMAYWKVGPTEIRIVLAAGALALLAKPVVSVAGREVLLFDVGGVIAAAGLATTAVVAVIRHTRALYVAEPLPRRHEELPQRH